MLRNSLNLRGDVVLVIYTQNKYKNQESKEDRKFLELDQKSFLLDTFDLDKPFLSGFGSIMNVPGNYYSYDKYASISNNDALASDWNTVGDCFWDALSSFK